MEDSFDSSVADSATEGEELDSSVPTDGSQVDSVGDSVSENSDSAAKGDTDSADGPITDSASETSDVQADSSDSSPSSLICGDAIRDPKTEECDDGLGTAQTFGRACSASCQVTDNLVAEVPSLERRLGNAKHRVACGGGGGMAVVFLERAPIDAGGNVQIGVATFGKSGLGSGIARLQSSIEEANPAIASLPDGSYALAFVSKDKSGSGLDVMMSRVAGDGSSAQVAQRVNESFYGPQHSVDLVWSGTDLVVSWLDDSPASNPSGSGRRLCSRRYDSSLNPASSSPHEVCGDELQALPSGCSLAGAGGKIARVWREDTGTTASVVVESGSWTQRFELQLPPDEAQAPSLVWLDKNLLVGYVDAAGKQRIAVLDPTGVPLYGPVVTNQQEVSRFDLTAVGFSQGAFMAWREPISASDPDAGWSANLDELWLQSLVWTGSKLDVSQPPMALPRFASHRLGDQRAPSLAVCEPNSPGAETLIAAWEDMTSSNYANESTHGDVALQQIPLPILRGLTQ